MTLLDGKQVVQKKEEELLSISKECFSKYNKMPCLAILSNNKDDASQMYIKRIEKNCSKFGINVRTYISNNDEDFIKNFESVNSDDTVTGIMFQEPLSSKLKKLVEKIDYKKDVEGITTKNLGKLFLNKEDKIIPCTAKAVVDILEYYGIVIEGKKIVILGRSNIVGKPLALELISKNGTVTICHSKTSNVGNETKEADIVVVAIGKPNYLKAENIKVGAIIIDVGINVIDGKIVGDVDFESVKSRATAITPVPGGVGVVTNYCLIENIFKTFKIQNEKK